MRIHPLYIAWACLALVHSSVQAAPPDEPKQIQKLVAQLASEQFAERESATRELEDAGAPALVPLRAAAASHDLEMRRRAEELVARIERRVESSRLLAGKRVRLSLENTPLPAAVEELNRQTGLSMKLSDTAAVNLADRKVTLRTGELGVWEALDQFCSKCELTELRPGVLASGKTSSSTCYAGALRIRAGEHASHPGWGQSQGVYEAPCVLAITPEPSVQWQGVLEVRIRHAIDDQGQKLEQSFSALESADDPYANDLSRRMILSRSGVVESSFPTKPQRVSVTLKLGQKAAHSLKELEGVIVGRMQTSPETIVRATDVLQASGKALSGSDGTSLKFGEITRDKDGRCQIPVDLRTPIASDAQLTAIGNPRRQMNQILIMQLKIQSNSSSEAPNLVLHDAKGQAFDSARYNESYNVTDQFQQYSATLHFQPKPGQGEPAGLSFIGRRTVTVEVPFRLKDVPLP